MAVKKTKTTAVQKRNARKQIEDFKKDYPNVELAGMVDKGEGQYQFMFKPKLATLDPYSQAGVDVPADLKEKMSLNASVMYRDPLYRQDLDLVKPDVVNEKPQKLYQKMRGYYRSKDVFGSFIDTMVDLAVAGFENDCEDLKIKEFYDNWCFDVDIDQVLEWIFQEYYITGFVRTYKVVGKYTPQVNTLKEVDNPPEPKVPKKATAERKKKWSKGYIPLAYTVMNPEEIELRGSVFLDQTRVVLTPNDEMKMLVKREENLQTPLTDSEKETLDSIPPEIKTAIKSGKEIELDPEFVGAVDNKRMPFERYPLPPFCRALEVVEYKERMREADYSTLDGITSEILVVTVGDKDNPVLDDDDLRKVSQLFNTVQKAYAVIWNHTLKVERVEMKNVNQIFGAEKFQQAETDMSGSIGIARALLDGVVIGNSSKDALGLSIKGLVASLRRVRRMVARWLHNEYKQIADAYGFKRFPGIRWDENVLKDELAIATVVMGLVDRRVVSYYTAHKMLGLDPEFERKQLAKEKPSVINGDLGILGSPYQQNKGGGVTTQQPTQKTPSGTPSEGRPSGQPSPKTPAPATPEGHIKEVIHKETKHVKEDIRRGAIQAMREMSLSELAELENILKFAKIKKVEELANLVEQVEVNREDNE